MTSPAAQPNSGAFDEAAGFKKFNPAFMGLLGRSAQLTTAEMQQFTDFILQVAYPPNPVRKLDNSLTPAQQAAQDFFFGTTITPHGTCESCHALDPQANPGEGTFAGFFGTDGRTGFAPEPQAFKVPHLRNMYQKVGMFGAAFPTFSVGADPFMGEQIRGVGFSHDGTFPTLFRFISLFDQNPTNPLGIPVTPEGDQLKRDMEQYMLAFDTNLAPIVGQQVTLTAHNYPSAAPRIHLLKNRAEAGDCELVAKGNVWHFEAGFLYLGGGRFKSDRQALPSVSDEALRAAVIAGDGVLTYTCTPLGSGRRIGIDRDLDGALDGDEQAVGSNPANPSSVP